MKMAEQDGAAAKLCLYIYRIPRKVSELLASCGFQRHEVFWPQEDYKLVIKCYLEEVAFLYMYLKV
jgi:hypothetical protein